MKYTITVLAAFFVALSVAQWPCHDYGFNGAIANCASCNIQGNVWAGSAWYPICTNCTNGFFLNQSACVPCANNCTSCTSNGACTAGGCAPGFAFIPTNSTCSACPTSLNCGTCTYTNQGAAQGYGLGPFTCTTCINNGYYKTSAGACVACANVLCSGTQGVAATASATTQPWSSGSPGCSSIGCTACITGYYLVSTSTSATCTACPSNCLTCTSANAGFCSPGGCAAGFGDTTSVAATNLCAACGITGCAACAGGLAASTCSACTTGLYLTAGAPPTCATTVCTANCVSCNGAASCGTCATGYYVNSATGTCGACSVANCTTCAAYASTTSVGGWCTACAKNTTLQNGVCYSCNANCTACALLSSSATTTVCLQCQLGYGLNDTTGVCVPCPPNCDYCDGSGVCTQCRQAAWNPSSQLYPVVGGSSYFSLSPNYNGPVIQVTQGYFLPPNQCQQCPYNCSSCANSTFCWNNCTKNYAFNSTLNLCLPNGVERIVFAGFAFLTVIFYFV